MNSSPYHRPTVVYLDKAACEHELKALREDISPHFREQNRLQARQLREVVEASKRRALWNANGRRR